MWHHRGSVDGRETVAFVELDRPFILLEDQQTHLSASVLAGFLLRYSEHLGAQSHAVVFGKDGHAADVVAIWNFQPGVGLQDWVHGLPRFLLRGPILHRVGMHHTDFFPTKFGDCAVLVGEGARFASVASGTDLEQRQAWVLRSQRTPDI